VDAVPARVRPLTAPLAAIGPTASLAMTLGALGAGAIGLEAGERIAARASQRAPRQRTGVHSRAWTDNAPRF
jgi:hypothetical protein